MAKEFKLPQLSEGVESATVAQIMVSEGDKIEKEQVVFELETEKASTEVPSDIAGTVSKVHVAEGDEAKVGQTMITFKEDDGDETEAKKDEVKEEPPQEGDEEQKEEKEEEKTPAKEEEQEPKAESEEAESDQADESSAEDETEDDAPAEDSAPAKQKTEEPDTVPVAAAPSVRRFAREIGVEIEKVEGNGPNGRISKDDVKRHSRSQKTGEERSAAGRIAPKLPDFSQWGPIDPKPMDKVRKLTAEQMVRSSTIIPQAVQFGRADISAIDKLHETYRELAEEAGGHLSLTVVLLKALAGALKHFPRFNTSLDDASDEIIYKEYINIGIAMDTGRGLVVPVLRDCNQKSILELSVELKELTQRARDGKLQIDDMRGGNMTITNAGALGGDLFIPIVNWPEAAILGVAQSRIEAVFEDGSFQPKPMLPLALAYDHRINDGADSVRFLQWIIESLENPLKMAVEG